MSPLRTVWRLLDARQRRQLIGLQALSLLMAVTTLASVASVLPFLAALSAPGAIASNPGLAWLSNALGFTDERGLLAVLGFGFVALVLLANAVNFGGMLLMTRFSHQVGDRFHTALLDYYLTRDYQFHAERGSATLTHNVLYAAGRLAGGLLESALIATSSAVTAALILAGILFVSPRLGAAALLWIGGSYLAVYLFARRRLLRNGRRENAALATRARTVADALALIKQVLLQSREDYFRDRFSAGSRELSKLAVSNHALTLAPRYLMESVMVVGLTLAFIYLARGGSEQFAQLSFLGFAAYRLLPGFQQLFAALVRMRANRGALEAIVDDLAAALHEQPHPRADVDPWGEAPAREIALDEVTFTYGGAPEPALRGVSVQIPAGSMVAITGENGAGKTTLADLVAGLLVPQSGALCVDGRRVDERSRRAWRARVAYVPQEVLLFDASIAQNIAFGERPEHVDRARLDAAVAAAQLGPVIARMPRGLDEPVGDRGARLSGGQRQRVGIARALYREVSVLVMDEGTSALDGLSEREVIEVLQSLRGRCTILTIAHRPTIVRHCDLIIRLSDGRLAGMERNPRADAVRLESVAE